MFNNQNMTNYKHDILYYLLCCPMKEQHVISKLAIWYKNENYS